MTVTKRLAVLLTISLAVLLTAGCEGEDGTVAYPFHVDSVDARSVTVSWLVIDAYADAGTTFGVFVDGALVAPVPAADGVTTIEGLRPSTTYELRLQFFDPNAGTWTTNGPWTVITTEAMAPPTSIAALGDSITRGFNASGFYVDWPSRSWSTGTESGVNSIYQRLLASEPAIAGNNFNLSQSGAKMVHLNGQAADAVASDAELVTILMGANDVCTSSEATMTPASTYRAQFATAMNTLSTGLPDTRVFVASIPDVHRLWEVGHTSFAARTAWGTYRICQSLLASPTSTATADVERRERVRQRVVEYNAALRDVCAEHVLCTYDDDAAFEVPFVLSDLSGWDYFHPNRAGQTKAAAALWPAVAAITTEPPTAPAAALVAEPAG